MANKIKLGRGTKARIESIKGSLSEYEIVYATDTFELGVKHNDGTIKWTPRELSGGGGLEYLGMRSVRAVMTSSSVATLDLNTLEPTWVSNGKYFVVEVIMHTPETSHVISFSGKNIQDMQDAAGIHLYTSSTMDTTGPHVVNIYLTLPWTIKASIVNYIDGVDIRVHAFG